MWFEVVWWWFWANMANQSNNNALLFLLQLLILSQKHILCVKKVFGDGLGVVCGGFEVVWGGLWCFGVFPWTVISSNEQSKCYIKCYKRRTKYTYPLFWLPSNQFTRFFINTLLCVAMVTMLTMYILQKVRLCAADYNYGYMNKTMFTLIA